MCREVLKIFRADLQDQFATFQSKIECKIIRELRSKSDLPFRVSCVRTRTRKAVESAVRSQQWDSSMEPSTATLLWANVYPSLPSMGPESAVRRARHAPWQRWLACLFSHVFFEPIIHRSKLVYVNARLSSRSSEFRRPRIRRASGEQI